MTAKAQKPAAPPNMGSADSTPVPKTAPAPYDAEQVKAALAHAKETHQLVIEWVRSFDFKIGPILTADSVLFAGSLALLTQQTLLGLLAACPVAHFLLALTPLPLLQSLAMSISAVSPSLRWKPWEWRKRSAWGKPGHLPDKSLAAPNSVIFFGQIACFEDEALYASAAKDIFADDAALLEEVLSQTYLNAKIAVDKSHHIALSARGLFAAITLLFLAGLSFLLKI